MTYSKLLEKWNSLFFETKSFNSLKVVRILIGFYLIFLGCETWSSFDHWIELAHPEKNLTIFSIPFRALFLLSSFGLLAGFAVRVTALTSIFFIEGLTFVGGGGELPGFFLLESILLLLSIYGKQTSGSVVWIRLMQFRLCFAYLSSALVKLNSESWTDGTALSAVMGLPTWFGPAAPDILRLNSPLIAVLTYGVIALEFALGLFLTFSIFSPETKCKRLFLTMGILFHVAMIPVVLHFQIPMIALLLLFWA